MSTQQQIDDPGQWRVGDVFEGECDGHPFSGPIWVDEVGGMIVGMTYVRRRDGVLGSGITGHVTRTVEPIPEPTEPWALVRFEDDSTALRDEGIDFPWLMSESATWTSWGDVVSTHGAPVAVSLPRWSDEVDGLRARVEKLADEWERAYTLHRHIGDPERPCETFARAAAARAFRALLTEGGEV